MNPDTKRVTSTAGFNGFRAKLQAKNSEKFGKNRKNSEKIGLNRNKSE